MTSQGTHTVAITGGAGGIGYPSALGIAKTGARIFIAGRSWWIIEEAGNGDVELVVGDLSSIAGIDALARALLEQVELCGVPNPIDWLREHVLPRRRQVA